LGYFGQNDCQFSPYDIGAFAHYRAGGVIIFIVGFSRHGVDFVKHGFKQNLISELTAQLAAKEDINRLELATRKDIGLLKADVGRLDAKIAAIEVNHFGHLKNYLGILNGVLLDKDIIDNETKARLDNELRGMSVSF
jgi:hypothetical protein